ncbi:hypothetical protein F4809DRAFT_638433 [Biscogniauxia mediterranea]|nr:hypothetical protein F4809DRAFT_638433 [Biscogniauxia mediterranea]
MAPTSMPPFIVGLMNSGDYSDLVLVCGDHRIEVHKAIICPQSPVLAAYIRCGFKKNAVDVNFDFSVCQQMARFLYTGDYEVPQLPSVDGDDGDGTYITLLPPSY